MIENSIMNKKNLTAVIILTILLSMLLLLTGCADSSSTPQTAEPDVTQPSLGKNSIPVVQAEPIIEETYTYDGGFFYINLPAGWVIDTVGEYINFGFRAYDPDKPARQIFYYGKQDILLKSQEEKEQRQALADLAGANEQMGYHLMADAPVLYQTTTAGFFSIYDEYAAYIKKYGITHELTAMNDFSEIESFGNSSAAVPNCLDNSIVRASFKSAGGTECQALLSGQVIDYFTDYNTFPGIDMGFYVIYSSCGVVAPTAEFSELENILTQCLTSFTFTDAYVQQAQQSISSETEAILLNAKATQAVYDSYNAAWEQRQTSYDISSQKYSDATLGYDRLYDSETGEIYRAELGFYDEYDANRSSYDNSNLQLIDDSTEQYYLNTVDYYIN